MTDLSHRDFSGTSDDLSTGGGDLSAGGGDLAGSGSGDGGASDLAGRDFAVAHDLSVAADLAPPRDLASTDLTPTADLAPTADLKPPCGVVPQSGCGPGEKCTLGPTNQPECVSNGSKNTGQQCGTTGADDCVAGDLCTADAPSPAPAICRAFCTSDANCSMTPVPSGTTPEPNNISHCTISITGTPDKVCTVACNPVTAAGASGCVAGQGCVYGGAAGVPELTDCETAGTGTDNFNCTKPADCANGFACVGAPGMTRCRQVCRNGNDNDCSNIFDVCDPPSGVTNPMFGFCCDFLAGC